VIDNIYCLVIIIAKDDSNIAAVQFKITLFDFFYQSKQLNDYIYTDIYCKLSKCIAMDRLRVRMNILLFLIESHFTRQLAVARVSE